MKESVAAGLHHAIGGHIFMIPLCGKANPLPPYQGASQGYFAKALQSRLTKCVDPLSEFVR
jgi:hypothetical protein